MEKELVRKLARAIHARRRKEEIAFLRDIKVHVNMATNSFKKIWSPWYSDKIPPRLEADLILVFEDPTSFFEKALLVAVEAKYFRGQYQRFFVGVQQALAFSLLGFDGLSLWHIFSEKVSMADIKKKSEASLEIIKGFNLPVFYIALRVEGSSLNCVSPFKLSGPLDVSRLITYVSDFFVDGKNRNPLLRDPHVVKRRKTLKVLLGIPV